MITACLVGLVTTPPPKGAWFFPAVSFGTPCRILNKLYQLLNVYPNIPS